MRNRFVLPFIAVLLAPLLVFALGIAATLTSSGASVSTQLPWKGHWVRYECDNPAYAQFGKGSVTATAATGYYVPGGYDPREYPMQPDQDIAAMICPSGTCTCKIFDASL